MQDENVARHDLGKVSFERAVGCFGTCQLERATRFQMSQFERDSLPYIITMFNYRLLVETVHK